MLAITDALSDYSLITRMFTDLAQEREHMFTCSFILNTRDSMYTHCELKIHTVTGINMLKEN